MNFFVVKTTFIDKISDVVFTQDAFSRSKRWSRIAFNRRFLQRQHHKSAVLLCRARLLGWLTKGAARPVLRKFENMEALGFIKKRKKSDEKEELA